jgi:precorrin-3B methylase
VAVATDVARAGESIATSTLAALDVTAVTMRSLVLVAGETAHHVNGWLVATRS